MKKQELLKQFDDDLLDKLFGFCYARTNDSYEAQELCSDIIFALIKAAHTEGEITNLYPFIWRIARNVYADFSSKKRKYAERVYDGDADEILNFIPDEVAEDDSEELLTAVYRRIAFLTKAYREVMIMFYIDSLPVAEIAKLQNATEGAVRQRLFSARQKIRSEVEKMSETYNKPVALDNINFVIWGTGNPGWGDPREGFTRTFSKHVVWLCHKKPMSASEIAEELNVPTAYVEDELEILCKGENGEYGLLRRLDSGKYAINFILFDRDVMEMANALYTDQLPKICDIVSDFVKENEAEYLSFPYLNKKVDMNLILWQQISGIAFAFTNAVNACLLENHFSNAEKRDRPFSVFGYVDNGRYYGGGWDGIGGQNICGFSKVHLDNIYITRIKKHFACGHNLSADPQLQLAIRAVDGLSITSLTEQEKEQAAKAVECGYLYREGDMLYTKILVSTISDSDNIFDITNRLRNGYFDSEAAVIAEKIAELIKKSVPDYLMGEWSYANTLASMPLLDAITEYLIEKGVLTPPEDGIGAEGCWMFVEK